MVKFWLSLVVLIGFVAQSMSAEPLKKVAYSSLDIKKELMLEVVPKELEGKVWNRWTSPNFTVLSLNDTQAQYLYKHLELVKTWIYGRWGLPDIPFTTECKLVCVDDPILFEKMFRLKGTKTEIRLDESGKLKESIVYVLVNDAPSSTIPMPLTEVCLAQFAQRYDLKIGWWAYRGMALLNGSLSQMRASLNSFAPIVEANKPIYFSKGLFEMTKEQYLTLDAERRQLYDEGAFIFCLMLRKEFGQDRFHTFLKVASDKGSEVALHDVLGFKGYDDFDRTFKRYMLDLTRDVLNKKTPDSYLQIREKSK